MVRSLTWWVLLVAMAAVGCGGDTGSETGAPDTDQSQPEDGQVVEDGEDDDATGSEVPSGAILAWSPPILDFGLVPHGELATLDLTISNKGNAPLVLFLNSIVLDPDSAEYDNLDLYVNGDIVKRFPTQKTTIEPSQSITISLWWYAVNPIGNQGDPIGRLLLVSSDVDQGLVELDIFGQVDAPILTLIPEAVDFLFVGLMSTVERTLTIYNEGTSDLIINEIGDCFEIVDDAYDEFDFKVSESFPPTDKASCGPGVIPGNTGQVVTLTYTRLPKDTAMSTAILKFTSNDPGMLDVMVPLKASIGDPGTCEPLLTPPTLNFGEVSAGQYQEKTFKLFNNGDGYCSFKSATIEDCTVTGEGEVDCAEPGTGFVSKFYTYPGLPPAVQNGIGPGGHVMLPVRFTPPTEVSGSGLLPTCWARATAVIYDPHNQQDIQVPPQYGGAIPTYSGWSPNLFGSVCITDCLGKECGNNGCGGSCGECDGTKGLLCLDDFKCHVIDETPDCKDKECGPDGIGGFCGECDVGETCSEQDLCIEHPCPGVHPEYGKCEGNLFLFCTQVDGQDTLITTDCSKDPDKTCGWDPASGQFACIDQEAP